MQIKITNQSTKQINNNKLTTYNLLINNKYNLTTTKLISKNKTHYTINDTQHNILLNNNIIINNKIFFNKITKLLK